MGLGLEAVVSFQGNEYQEAFKILEEQMIELYECRNVCWSLLSSSYTYLKESWSPISVTWKDNFRKCWPQIVIKPELPLSSSERIESLRLLDRRDCCSGTSCTDAVYPSLWNCKLIGRVDVELYVLIALEFWKRGEGSAFGKRRAYGREPRRGANAVFFGSFGK